jgi:hypothetical protein
MKTFYYIILLLISLNTKSQCFDVFGRNSDCPTEEDSLIVYNNALKVYEFYEKNPDYTKLKTTRLKTKQDVINCFYQLEDALDTFNIRWLLRERVLNGENIPSVLLPRNGKNIPKDNYYVYIDNYRFYQRELESGILNTSSPFPLYDIRISPLIINSYENKISYDENNGDFVNVALYIPVTVKPFRLLTDSERIVRENILRGVKLKPKPNKTVKTIIPKTKSKNIDTTLLSSSNLTLVLPKDTKEYIHTYPPNNATPVYHRNPYGGGCLIGYMIGRKFRKFLSTDEFYWSLPKWYKEFLKNDLELEKYLRIIFGGYYDGLY